MGETREARQQHRQPPDENQTTQIVIPAAVLADLGRVSLGHVLGNNEMIGCDHVNTWALSDYVAG